MSTKLLTLVGLAGIALAQSQAPTDITLTFDLATQGDVADTGPGTITPFGGAQVALHRTGGLVDTFTFTFLSGDTLVANVVPPYTVSTDGASGQATFSSGTGIFANATGSFSFQLTGETISQGVSMTGNGSITLATAVSGPGGSGYPPVSCSGPTSSIALEGGNQSANVNLEVCTGIGATGSGGSVHPILFPNSGPSLLPPPILSFNGAPVLPIPKNLSGDNVTLWVGPPPLLQPNLIYIAEVSCGNAPSTLDLNECWIIITSPTATTGTAGTTPVLPAVANPSGLGSGLYTANVGIATTTSTQTASQPGNESARASTSGTTLNIPISMLITENPLITLSSNGMRFQAIAGSVANLAQTIVVSNSGMGNLSFSATASTLSGGNWLSVSTTPTQVNVQANPTGLAAGTYYGRVDVAGQGGDNSPQSAEVVLTVLSASASNPPQISASGLIFAAEAGQNPASQKVSVSNVATQSLTISATASGLASWLTAASSGSVLAPGQSLTETVSVNTTGLAAGVYRGTLTIAAQETGSSYPVAVALVVVPATGGCTPTELIPVFTNLANGFQIPAGEPATLQAQIVDDCGTPMSSGAVTSYFPKGDPPGSLAPLGNGAWQGSWMPHSLAGGTASAGIIASSTTPGVYGTAAVTGTISANAALPMIASGGAVSAASLALGAPLAPGGFISIFGSNLAPGSNPVSTYPYPPELGGTQVLLGGEPLPLEYAGPGQINAVIPYDVPVNSTLQLIVTQNGASSMPETVLIGPAQPSVFTQDQSGTGAGAVLVIQASGAEFLNTPSAPAGAGDVLAIYCTGLGAVSPPVPAGSAAPAATLSRTVTPATVTIGGVPAQVSFAGLAPGFAGLYQVNATVPAGVTAGAAVPLIVSEGGSASPAVTVAVH
jgi:uncharacterized protein (TIGR03437 family)